MLNISLISYDFSLNNSLPWESFIHPHLNFHPYLYVVPKFVSISKVLLSVAAIEVFIWQHFVCPTVLFQSSGWYVHFPYFSIEHHIVLQFFFLIYFKVQLNITVCHTIFFKMCIYTYMYINLWTFLNIWIMLNTCQ